MLDELFVLLLAAGFYFLFRWAFRTLPAEKWQVIASRPVEKTGDGNWKGVNYTFYGFFIASAYIFATMTTFVLLGAMGVPVVATITMVIGISALCVPSSKLIANIIEKKKATFSVGGASFVGVIAAPLVVAITRATLGTWMNFQVYTLSVLATIAIGYAFGEGLGRMACMSFGCCFGKPMEDVPEWIRKLFQGRAFVFTGKTKKISYAGGLEGREVMPIQAVTTTIYCGTGLFCTYLFLKGFHGAALFISIAVTQIWRILSEFLRADFRGGRKFTFYQYMCLGSLFIAAVLAWFLPVPPATSADLGAGLATLWNPAILLLLQVLWVIMFLFFGTSETTASEMNIHVVQEKI